MATKSATAITSSLCASCGQELECSIRPKGRTTTSWVRAGFECSWCGKKIEGAVYRCATLLRQHAFMTLAARAGMTSLADLTL